jgi:type VI secretion system protein ImpM
VTPVLPQDARVGLYGKLPARGDFVREALPRDFVEAWDDWWQRGLASVQARWAEAWRDAWLEAPVWRFVLPPGLCGADGVLGLWMPSVDKAGRFFPLTIGASAACDWAPFVPLLARFLDEAEEAGRDALEHDLGPADLLARVQAAFGASDPPQAMPATATATATGAAAWWTDGGPRVAARREAGAALPEGDRFAGLIDDAWREADAAAPPIADQPAEHP